MMSPSTSLRITSIILVVVGCPMLLFVFFSSYATQAEYYKGGFTSTLTSTFSFRGSDGGKGTAEAPAHLDPLPAPKVRSCPIPDGDLGESQPPGCYAPNGTVETSPYSSIPPPLPKWKKIPTVERITDLFESSHLPDHGMCDCSRVLVHDVRWQWGLGSQVEIMLASFEHAFRTNRTFIVSDRFLTQYTCSADADADDRGAASCFLPGHVGPCGACDMAKLAGLRAHPERLPSGLDPANDGEPHVVISQSQGRGPSSELRLRRYDRDAMAAFALSRLWVLTEGGSVSIAERVARLPRMERPICALHVRRGDAAGDGRRAMPVAEYMRVLDETTAEADACRTIYVMTDDPPHVLPEILEAVHSNNSRQGSAEVVTMPQSQSMSGWRQDMMSNASREVRRDLTLDFLAELEVLRAADVFIGDWSSNVGRLVTRLRIMTGWPRATVGYVGWA